MSRPIAVWLAVAVAGLTIAVGVGFHTFVASGTDQAAYIEAGHRWAAGRVAKPSPLQFSSPWSASDFGVAPFGFRPGVARGSDVGEYPLGLPILMAAAIAVGGSLAAYLVVPVCAGILVWCTYVLGACLAGPWGGLLAATILAASPVTLAYSVQPMSDVPAAAFWTLAWAMSIRPGLGASAAAGAAVTMAIMIRPNLAPLAAVIAALLWSHRGVDGSQAHQGWRRLVVFVCLAAVGPAIVGWCQRELYGSPFRVGYLGAADFYRLSHIRQNLALHPRLLAMVHTPLIFAGLPAVGLLAWSGVRARLDASAARVAWSAAALITLNYMLYLPFQPFTDLTFVRFVLPAFAALCLLLAGLVVHVAGAIGSRSRVAAALCVIPAIVVSAYPSRFVRHALDLHDHSQRILLAGRYLREVLPADAAIITGVHGGGLAHYTGRVVVRLDPISPAALDGVIEQLRRQGYRPVLVLDGTEVSWFQTSFAQSRWHALDWPPRAAFVDISRMVYWDVADRDAHLRGERWPVDVLQAH